MFYMRVSDSKRWVVQYFSKNYKPFYLFVESEKPDFFNSYIYILSNNNGSYLESTEDVYLKYKEFLSNPIEFVKQFSHELPDTLKQLPEQITELSLKYTSQNATTKELDSKTKELETKINKSISEFNSFKTEEDKNKTLHSSIWVDSNENMFVEKFSNLVKSTFLQEFNNILSTFKKEITNKVLEDNKEKNHAFSGAINDLQMRIENIEHRLTNDSSNI